MLKETQVHKTCTWTREGHAHCAVPAGGDKAQLQGCWETREDRLLQGWTADHWGESQHGNEGMKAQHSSAQLKRWKVMESVPNQNGKTFKQRITRKKETYGKTHQRSVLGLASFPKWDMRTTTSLQDQKRNDLYGECQESSNAPLPSHHVREEKSGSLCFWVDTNAWCQGRREAPGATQMCTLSATHTKALDSGVLVGNANIYRDSCIFMEHSFFRWGATPLTLQLNGSVAVHTSKLREFKLISSTPIKNWFSQQDQGTRPHNFVVQPACQKNKSLDNTSCITLMWQLLLGQLIQSIGHDYGKGCGKLEQRLWDVTELQQQNWKVPISPFLTFSQRQSIPI